MAQTLYDLQLVSTGYDVECDTSAPQPSLQDCENLTSYLINLNETISIPPESVIEADGGNCFYKYGVVDNVSYDVCTNTWVCFAVFDANEKLIKPMIRVY